MTSLNLKIFATFAVSVTLASCGGGGKDGELLSGIFSDSPVSGLRYVTPTASGVTDEDGVFNYREGEAVVFSIGGLALPVVVGAEVVTPLDMVATDDIADPEVLNIARLLQSVDADSNPGNGITISEGVASAFSEAVIFDSTNDRAVDDAVEQVFGGARGAVSAAQALDHFVSAMSSAAGSSGVLDKLHYIVPHGKDFTGDSVYVDEQNFTLSIDNQVHSGSASVSHGVYQFESADNRWFVSIDDLVTTDGQLACFSKSPVAVVDCDGDLYHVFKEEQGAIAFGSKVDTADLSIGAATEGAATEEPAAPVESAELENAELLAALFPPCDAGTIDDNGDGFGWQNNESCLITSAEETTGDDTVSEVTAEAPVVNAGQDTQALLESLFPACDDGTVDADKDGYGWQDDATCLIVENGVIVAAEESTAETPTETTEQTAQQPEQTPVTPQPEPAEAPVAAPVPVVTPDPVVQTAPESMVKTDPPVVAITPKPVVEPEPAVEVTPEPAVEPDPVAEVTPEPVVEPDPAVEVTPEPVVEPDPVVEVTPAPVVEPDPEPAVVVAPDPDPVPVAIQASDITDIIVLTGQANAAAIDTEYDAVLDAGDERLFAYNEDGQWRAAELNQFWDADLPSNYTSAASGREPYNNLAFQVGKALTGQSDRVVGIIMLTAPGEGISHWDFNSAFYNRMRTKVRAALSELPQKTTVDAVIWMQGETDWLAEGTADAGATGFDSTDSDFYRNYYPNKLDQLISNLRSETWHGPDAQFICGETKKAGLNQHLMALNNDGDDLTACAAASDLPTLASDPFGNYFSAAGLRTLGDRIATLYSAAD